MTLYSLEDDWSTCLRQGVDTNLIKDSCSSIFSSVLFDQEDIICIIVVVIIKIIFLNQEESVESTTVNLSAIYDIIFMEPCQFEQYNEETEECNT